MDMNSPPDTLDDRDPPIQYTLFNQILSVVDSLFVGYDNGVLVAYFIEDLAWRDAGEYDSTVEQATLYTYNGATGESTGQISTFAFDPRIRPWYIDAKDACSTDLQGQYSCDKVWTDWYLFANSPDLGMTAAIGFANATGDGFEGVVAMDFTTADISDMFESATSGSISDEIAYLMDMDGVLIATSNGASVVDGNDERVSAVNSLDATISSSAAYILDNHYRSDQTLSYEDSYITVKNFVLDSMHWYIVVVADMVSDSTDCLYELEGDTLSVVEGDLNELLAVPENVVNQMTGSMFLNIVSTYSAPSAKDEENGMQDFLFSLYNGFVDQSLDSYIGYEDGTFLAYWGVFVFREDGDDLQRYNYNFDSVGHTVGGPVSSSTYDPRARPWYSAAVNAGSGLYSAPYVFAQDGTLGMTYAAPFYDGSTLMGVAAADYYIVDIDNMLSDYNSNGAGVFIFETQEDSEYNMIASSCHAVLTDSETETQLKAWNVEDYYISKISNYMNANSITTDGSYEYNGIPFTVRNYEKHTLSWRMVAYDGAEVADDDDDDDASSSGSGSDDDDELSTVVGLTSAVLVLAVIGIVLAVVAVIMVRKASESDRGASNKEVTMSPMSGSKA